MLKINNRNNTEENKKNRYISFKYLVEKRRRSVTFSNTELGAIDSDTLSESEFSTNSRSKTSSSGNSISVVSYNSWVNGDKDMGSRKLSGIKDSNFPKAKITNLRDISDTGRLNSAKDSFGLVVLGPGTRLMRDLLFPTVITQVRGKKLQTSIVYYMILEPTSGLYVGNIACLLYANPFEIEKDAITAEVLPLRMVSPRKNSGGISLSPMLLHEHRKSLFQKGCTFRVNAIEFGRRVN